MPSSGQRWAAVIVVSSGQDRRIQIQGIQESGVRIQESGVRMPPLPHNDSPDLDEERKKELIMEKKLRACRVNIIQRVSTHLHSYRGEVVSPRLPVFIL